MPTTDAQRQRAGRQRRAARLADLEAEAAELRAELVGVRTDLDDALAEVERLAGTQCKHPAGAVDAGTCRACGTEIW